MRLTERDVLKRVRRLSRHDLHAWIRTGWVCPANAEGAFLFDELDVARLRLICDLRSDMGLPSDAVPMVLSLVDQLHGLRKELRSLLTVIDEQPSEIRDAIRKALVGKQTSEGP